MNGMMLTKQSQIRMTLQTDISELESFEFLKEYNDWQVEINEDLPLTYLYFFRNSKGFAEISVILNERKEWFLLF